MQPENIKKAKATTHHLHPAARWASIRYALNGIRLLLQEPNAQIHLLATVAVIVAGIIRQLQAMQWAGIALAAGLVWTAEALNTAIEYLCDYACDGKFHPLIKKVKDISAGAVLLAAITSVIIAIFIFIS